MVINDDGEVCRTYRKMHLFDVDIPSKNVKIQESNTVEAGDEISPPVETPIGNVGLAIVSFFDRSRISNTVHGKRTLRPPNRYNGRASATISERFA